MDLYEWLADNDGDLALKVRLVCELPAYSLN